MALTDSNTGLIRGCWIRSSTSVTLGITANGINTVNESFIVNESYISGGNESYFQCRSEEAAEFIVRQECPGCISGKLCVQKDGSVYVRNPKDSNDVSCKYAQQ